ncbi:MAG: hypothetical protein ACKVPX_07305 [Myxococcaceae bacterium]
MRSKAGRAHRAKLASHAYAISAPHERNLSARESHRRAATALGGGTSRTLGGGSFATALIELGLASEDDVLRTLSEAIGVERALLDGRPIDPQVLAKVTTHFCEQRHVFPVELRAKGKTLVLAMGDPTDLSIIDDAEGLSRCKVVPLLASELEIGRAIDRHYKGIMHDTTSRARKAVVRAGETPDFDPADSQAAAAGGFSFSRNETEFDPEALSQSSADNALERMLAPSDSGWSDADIARLHALRSNQKRSAHVLTTLIELLVEKGALSADEALLGKR